MNETSGKVIKDGIDPFVGPSFSIGNRLLRVAWGLVYLVLFRFTPRPMHAWRSLLLRAFGARLGEAVHVYPSARVWAPWNLEMHDYSCLGDGVECYSMARITIGKKAVVSQRANLCSGTHDFEDPLFQLQAKPIVIGSKAWVCTEAFVGPGVSVGEGAVLGARGVATRNLDPWKVYAGNPCRELRARLVRSR